ncbi:MAG: ABC transporter ATP-binding protein [Bacteroidetes bacterium]|jgi:ABC-2 type transport system ATP-binding protein|nr:ABC transporter ATP-binding protein [Bacteroidota bacterium]
MIFTATNIVKQYPRSKFQLQVPNITLSEGAIVGVVGENGNGKTTLLNIVAGELEASGSLNYFGEEVKQDTDWSALKSKIAFIPQRIPRWYGSLIQNLKLKAALDGIPAEESDAYLDEILSFLGLMDYKHLKWTEISTGYRLRFELARMLIGKPNLLVLDEPLANLDINTQQKFLSDLKNILQDKSYSTAVILSSQQLHEIETVSDHMIFLRKGESVFSGAVNELEADHDQFVFEVQVEAADKARLLTYLQANNLTYGATGEYLQVSIDKTGTSNDFLSDLIKEGFTVKYYRNISKSTKRLFNQ